MLEGTATDVVSVARTAASGSAVSTETLFVKVPEAVEPTAATMVTVAVAPEASDGMVAVAVPPEPFTVPLFVEVPEVNVTPVGSVLVATIFVAVDGPVLRIVMT